MAQDREPFLTRWSRRKRTLERAPAEPKPPAQADAPPPELPSIESLTPESDFSAFMHEQVDEKLRRAALKKLFSDPAFNVVDGLDDYAEDFTQLEALAEGAAAGLEHAKRTLLGRDPDAPAPEGAEGLDGADTVDAVPTADAGEAAPAARASDADAAGAQETARQDRAPPDPAERNEA